MNSAALRFVARESMADEGYGEYLSLFDETRAEAEQGRDEQGDEAAAGG